MSRPVALCADSTCDLNEELLNRYHIHIVPYNILVGDNAYHDGVDIDTSRLGEIYREQHLLPRTAAINMEDYMQAFRPLLAQGMDVVHVTLGRAITSSWQNCCLAAEELAGEGEGRVFVVDSCNLSSASGLVVLEAAKRIEAGLSAERVAAETQALTSRCHGSFVLNTLEFLHKGGRCSTVAMLGANVLQLKPCIEVSNVDSSMTVGKKYRGALLKARDQYVRDKLTGRDDIDYDTAIIVHTDPTDENAERLRRTVLEIAPFKNLYITHAGCTIYSHCGPETLGFMFMTKPQ